ncbi:MAG: fibrobacter succinogenes major paralogous domain-containing protein [Deferribacteres bacterium]|nr:fibrobacter succinogenes major paralogous domain-containing protein [candidate division KSB1 bacterium]MCB9500872.1 fibrobacter succinogenes major paralogous domain-containing protein [Deferribacteres bacterium]
MKKLLAIVFVSALVFLTSCDKKTPIAPDNEYQSTNKQVLLKSTADLNLGCLVFGPTIFERYTGKPETEVIEFSLQNMTSSYLIILTNGDQSKNSKVSSCTVVINDETIISTNELNKNVDKLEKEISLDFENEISVQVNGKPGSFLTITIYEISSCPCSLTDIDGNVYATIQIGDQCWMIENLRVTHYRNGEAIPNLTSNSDWSNTSSGAYCAYGNDNAYISQYGLLYNAYAVEDSRNIAPEGWHVATDAEWKELESYLGISATDLDMIGWRGTDEGDKIKSETGWNAGGNGTNESGFTAIPAGYRNRFGTFKNLGNVADFWTATENDMSTSWARELYYSHSEVYRTYGSKPNGFSVRLVRD